MKLIISATILAGILCAHSIQAKARNGEIATSDGMTSSIGEELAPFLKRVSDTNASFSKQTGNDVCATVEFKDGRYVVNHFENGRNLFCNSKKEHTTTVHNSNGKISIGVREFISIRGETIDAFVLRIAPEVQSFTSASGWETCGVVAEGPNGFGVRMVSSRGAMTCEMLTDNVPMGMKSLPLTLHTHPAQRNVRPTPADASYYAKNPNVAGRMIKVGRSESVGGAVFSSPDYAMPGYLIAEGKVLHQGGRGSERLVGHVVSHNQVQ